MGKAGKKGMNPRRLLLRPILAGVLMPLFKGPWMVDALAGAPGGSDGRILPSIDRLLAEFGRATGLYAFLFPPDGTWIDGLGRLVMVATGLLLVYLAIRKKFEPLLLLPIGIGAVMANVPLAGMNDAGGILHHLYAVGIKTGAFPLLIFMGVGAMTDFGPMLANPRTA